MELKIGGTLILEYKENSGQIRRYRCRIAEIRENALLIDYPVDEKTGRTPVFINGTPFVANYLVDGRVYRFRTLFLHRVSEKIPMMFLKFGGKESLKQIQRRNFVRVEANLDIAIHSASGGFRPFVTLTSDIGGGGTLIILPDQAGLNEEDEVEIWVCLPMASGENQYLRLKGKVVRVFTDRLTQGGRASVQFATSGDRALQPIIRFCFERQLESRKKMLEWTMSHPHD